MDKKIDRQGDRQTRTQIDNEKNRQADTRQADRLTRRQIAN